MHNDFQAVMIGVGQARRHGGPWDAWTLLLRVVPLHMKILL